MAAAGLVLFALGWAMAALAVLQNAFAVVAVRNQQDRYTAKVRHRLVPYVWRSPAHPLD